VPATPPTSRPADQDASALNPQQDQDQHQHPGPHPGLRGRPIYLDYNATTPVDPRVVDAILPYLTSHFGNPSSTHGYAAAPRRAVEHARTQVARLLGCAPGELVFTGGGSEADLLAIRGAALASHTTRSTHGRDRALARGRHVITQATEHPAVLETCASLQRLHGFHVTYLPVDQHGRVDPEALEAAITPQTLLVSIMHTNNETGTIQPIRALAQIAHRHGVLFHTDAAQSAGKIPVAVRALGVDLLSIAGHKLYAPKGIGALYVRDGVDLEPALYGGGQERGLRSGTENVAFVAALGAAADLAGMELASATVPARLRRLTELLHARLQHRLGERLRHNGHPSQRLPNTLNVSIDGIDGASLLARTPGIAAATGAACHEGGTEPSGVLLAMGMPPDRACGAVRLTLGRWTTDDDIEQAAELLGDAAAVQSAPTWATS